MLLVQSPAPQKPPTSEVVQVTGVKANPTNRGVEVILQTDKGQQLQITNHSAGNNFIADIPNAQLRLNSVNAFTFRSDKPIAGVSEITVTNYNATTIRVTVTGEAILPTVELFDSPNEGLIFSVASTGATDTQQKPQTQPTPVQQKPQNQTQPTQPSAQRDEPIELVVTGDRDGYRDPNVTTATKTDTPVRDIPQSIQEIPRAVIEDRVITNPDDAVRTVSGVIPSNPSYQGALDTFSIRGFDGNQTVLRNGLRELGGNVSRKRSDEPGENRNPQRSSLCTLRSRRVSRCCEYHHQTTPTRPLLQLGVFSRKLRSLSPIGGFVWSTQRQPHLVVSLKCLLPEIKHLH